MPHTNGYRLFFGFEHRSDCLTTVSLNAKGETLLRARFPLANACDLALDDHPVPDILATLQAFLRAHRAIPVSCTDRTPGILEEIALRLDGYVRAVDLGELEEYSLPGYAPLAIRRPLGIEAHQRALLAGLAATSALEDF